MRSSHRDVLVVTVSHTFRQTIFFQLLIVDPIIHITHFAEVEAAVFKLDLLEWD
jgi:hypothetical protein